MRPLVSIITPTCGRDHFLAEALRIVESQTCRDFEWVVLDDSPEPSAALRNHPAPYLRYTHRAERLPIGEKRNLLVDAARGEFIAHFDDDDYYSPDYLTTMLGLLHAHGRDFVKLSAWHLYDARHDFFGFWALQQKEGLHYRCAPEGVSVMNLTAQNNPALASNHLGYGFTYVYRRRVWQECRFSPVQWCEEAGFIDAARSKYDLLFVDDTRRLVLHLMHASNTSVCFSQFRLPSFLLPTLFDATSRFLGKARVAVTR